MKLILLFTLTSLLIQMNCDLKHNDPEAATRIDKLKRGLAKLENKKTRLIQKIEKESAKIDPIKKENSIEKRARMLLKSKPKHNKSNKDTRKRRLDEDEELEESPGPENPQNNNENVVMKARVDYPNLGLVNLDAGIYKFKIN